MSFNLASCAHYTLMDFSPIVDLSRSLKTNIFVKFAPLWNVMRSCLVANERQPHDLANARRSHFSTNGGRSQLFSKWGLTI